MLLNLLWERSAYYSQVCLCVCIHASLLLDFQAGATKLGYVDYIWCCTFSPYIWYYIWCFRMRWTTLGRFKNKWHGVYRAPMDERSTNINIIWSQTAVPKWIVQPWCQTWSVETTWLEREKPCPHDKGNQYGSITCRSLAIDVAIARKPPRCHP